MAKRVALSTLNASTVDIINTIRANASYDYQSSVPEVETAHDIPKVGEIITGTPAFANQFINALINRIALVRVKSATFNNPYSILKKGYIELGESIEEIFVQIAQVVDYSAEKAESRELKRTLPDVRSAFHTMNWRAMYPVTIEDNDLKLAFLSMDGVQDLIAKIVDSVYKAAEYDEFLLFKYLLIKGISQGQLFPTSIGAGTDLNEAAVAFRGYSNKLTFMSKDYNNSHVKTATPKADQIIFMDAMFNAQFDVNVLASAFNMDKADFMGRLFLIDDWTSFDNERWETMRAASDGLEEVTAAELALMANVKAVLVDEEWFQVYDNLSKFTEDYVSSGLYWNYFYHNWKTISSSPFSNAVVFCTSGATLALPKTISYTVASKDVDADGNYVFTLREADQTTIFDNSPVFVQTEALTAKGVAVNPNGGVIIPSYSTYAGTETLEINVAGTKYTSAAFPKTTAQGATVTFTSSEGGE